MRTGNLSRDDLEPTGVCAGTAAVPAAVLLLPPLLAGWGFIAAEAGFATVSFDTEDDDTGTVAVACADAAVVDFEDIHGKDGDIDGQAAGDCLLSRNEQLKVETEEDGVKEEDWEALV